MKIPFKSDSKLVQMISSGWGDYSLLDSGNGLKLEKYGDYYLKRPEPEAFWNTTLSQTEWEKTDAEFIAPTAKKEGYWQQKQSINRSWTITIGEIKAKLELSTSRHIGIFPEQYPQWIWIDSHIKQQKKPFKVLNLFGYTGIATMFAANAGAEVTHVDASRRAITWANENQALSNLNEKPIRWILDDALKFTKREARRKNVYDGIILDPPKFGRGPNGEIWEFYKFLPNLLETCREILSPEATFIMLTAYAIKASSITLQRAMEDYFQNLGGVIRSGELVQEEISSKKYLPRAIYSIWERE